MTRNNKRAASVDAAQINMLRAFALGEKNAAAPVFNTDTDALAALALLQGEADRAHTTARRVRVAWIVAHIVAQGGEVKRDTVESAEQKAFEAAPMQSLNANALKTARSEVRSMAFKFGRDFRATSPSDFTVTFAESLAQVREYQHTSKAKKTTPEGEGETPPANGDVPPTIAQFVAKAKAAALAMVAEKAIAALWAHASGADTDEAAIASTAIATLRKALQQAHKAKPEGTATGQIKEKQAA